MAENKWLNSIYPSVKDKETARKAALQGFIAAAFCSVTTVLFASLTQAGYHIFNVELYAFYDALLFAVIAWAIYKQTSRIAAVAGLFLYTIGRIDAWFAFEPKDFLLAAVIVLMFINSIRGTVAYHRPNPKR